MITVLLSLPKLVVLVVVDQFRYDYLSDFKGNILLKDGFIYTDCHHMHIPTYTAVGHATISTGVEPRIHGIISNYWYNRKTGKYSSPVDDPDFEKSPRNLSFPTIGDHLKVKYPKSKVVSISLKDRAAILLGGYLADVVLWMDKNFKFTTTGYYKKPPWLEEYNKGLSIKSDEDGIFKGNYALFELFKEAVLREELGKDEFPDIIFISFSSLDLAGHKFGPNSNEVKRLVLQMDTIISSTIDFLNENIGKGEYVLIFTSDHGVAPIPQRLGGRINNKELKEELNKKLKEEFKVYPAILDISSPWVFIDYSKVKGDKLKRVKLRVKELLMAKDFVLRAYTSDEIRDMQPRDFIDSLVINGFYEGAGIDVVYVPKPYWIFSSYDDGTNHGSPYFYDTHVPLIFYGLERGKDQNRCSITIISKRLREILELP